jgi:trk system potassium uptake protein TrkH
MSPILKYLGKIVFIAGVFTLVPAVASVLLGEWEVGINFILPALPSILLGSLLDRRYPSDELGLMDAFIVAALGWLLVPLIGSLPFILTLHASPLDAYFESISGFTTTGLSVFQPSLLPRTLVFWRSFTQWIGGIGVILLFLAVIGPTNVASRLYAAEGRTERLEPSIVRTANAIFYIYSLFTLLGFLFLYLAGSSAFESVNITFTAIATGGFSPYDDSYASSTIAQQMVVVLLMVVGAISFAVHQRWMNREYAAVYRNPEVRLLFLLILAFASFLYLDNNSILDSLFQTVSAVTCTGLSTLRIPSLSDHSIFFLLLLMVTGGGYGSTAGAIKLVRVLVIISAVRWYIRKLSFSPRTMVPLKMGGKVLKEEEVLITLLYVVLLGTTVFVLLDHPLIYSIFEVASAQGNVGLSVISDYTGLEKMVLIFHMWAGRLEIIPLLVLLSNFRERVSFHLISQPTKGS